MRRTTVAPVTQAEKEWVEGSGVSREIASLNIHTIEKPQEIAQLLNWKHYSGSGGWYVRSIDLHSGQYSRFGQFKPEEALLFPKGDGTEIILLLPDMATWERIADKYQVPITPEDIK